MNHKPIFLLLSLFLLVPACSSDAESPATSGDAGTDTDTGATPPTGIPDTRRDTTPDPILDTAPDAPDGDAASASSAFGPTDTIEGKTYPQWAAAWWKWALAIKKSTNPIEGGDCTQGQSGPVWFLAGTSDGVATTRTCTVPAGKKLFFPVVNALCYPCHEDEGCSTPKTAAELGPDCFGTYFDAPALLSAELDSVAVSDLTSYRSMTDVFSFSTPSLESDRQSACTGPIGTNTCGIPEGDRFGRSEGYWLMLKPLSAGAHTLEFKAKIAGATPAEDFVIDVTYDLTQL